MYVGKCERCGVDTLSKYSNKRKRFCGSTCRERITRSKDNGAPESYRAAKARCQNKNDTKYSYYGGRGIEFRFTNYAEFIACLGPRPAREYTLERINNNGHYEVGNVKWATRLEQTHNRRKYATVNR